MLINKVSTEEKVFVIAEVGNNHEGNFDVAQELVRQAAECGVDAVKFQTFQTQRFISPADHARFQRLTSFELSYREFERLQQLATSLGLLFISTPLDLKSAEFLAEIVDCFKIASGDNDFYPLIEYVCGTDKPLIISSGASDLDQVEKTVGFVKECWRERGISAQQLAILHCVSSYPVPPEEANLRSIPFLAERLDCTVGYSDHTIGVEACLAAVALGAQIIEKHFTLDKHYSDFRDHQLSADPAEMKQLVTQVKHINVMLGKPEKVIQPSEAPSASLIRRSIAASSDLPRGHQLKRQDLMWIRPGAGLRPGEEEQIIGRRLKLPISVGQPIRLTDLE
jgi:N,N'-diacetyllegionaminate synthase